jgi:hypothetical protein
VARGASNPEIATRLFPSRETVEYHLHEVVTTLGVGGRLGLARLSSVWQLRDPGLGELSRVPADHRGCRLVAPPTGSGQLARSSCGRDAASGQSETV